MKLKISWFTLIIFLTACSNSIHYPDGGYDYPKHVEDKDTNFYYYPLTNINPKHTFSYSYTYLLYQLFNEPNLSIKPLPKEVYRLTYRNAFHETTIITLSDNEITVKKGSTDSLFDMDTSNLTTIEKLHLKILGRWYPLNDTTNKHPIVRKYLDSMVKLYPELLDVNYYHSFYKNHLFRTNKKFIYTCSTIHLSSKQYGSIVEQINSSEFWHMPYFIECPEKDIADGGVYNLEANTKYKYQNVAIETCPNFKTKCAYAWQNLVRAAKLDNEIDIVWDESKIQQEHPDTSVRKMIIQDVQLEEIKPAHVKHKRNIIYLPNKEQKVQGSDTTKMP